MGAFHEYMRGRFTELLPQREKKGLEILKEINPIPALKLVDRRTWMFFLSSYLCIVLEASVFFVVSLNVNRLSIDFKEPVHTITWGITLSLMTRTIGAILFGYIADAYGQRISLIINMISMAILLVITGFATSFNYFLICRAIFGIGFGGCFGAATTQCLDDMPKPAHGLLSGLLQQGYPSGFLVATILTRALADTTDKTWRTCLWFLSGVAMLLAFFRFMLPDTNAQLERVRLKLEAREKQLKKTRTFRQIYDSFLDERWIIIYMVLMMIGFNFLSHASQDLFPTMLKIQLAMSHNASTVTNCIANIGAIIGGSFLPHMSNLSTRRFIILFSVICAAALVYPWGHIHDNSINASAFFLQFFVQGSWGVVPSHLHALAPISQTKSFFVGVSYQLGNLASSASATIESKLGEQYFPLPERVGANGEIEKVYDYGRVMAIFMWVVCAYLFTVVFLGPEKNPRRESLESGVDYNPYDNDRSSRSDETTPEMNGGDEYQEQKELKIQESHIVAARV